MSKSIDKSNEDDALTVNLMLKYIKPFLDDKSVTEVTINEPHEIWVKGFEGWKLEEVPELTESKIGLLITAIYTYNNKREGAIGSLLMPDGSRCQILRFPATLQHQVSVTIRKHSERAFTLDELYDGGSFDEWEDVSFNKNYEQFSQDKALISAIPKKDLELMDLKTKGDIKEFLRKSVLYQKNIVIAGKTGSGKTTFAKGLITEIPSDERIVTIEDVHELHLPNHPNHLHMMFGSGQGRVSAFDALMACMRISPDRILLAELRGSETWEYLMSLNTGHPGGITTVHANGAVHTFDRITGLIKSSEIGSTIDFEAIKMILYSTVDIVLYFDKRKLKEVFFDPFYVKQTLSV